MEYDVGDVVRTKKQHPCGSKLWELTRVGVDFKLKCLGCGHIVTLERQKAVQPQIHLDYATGESWLEKDGAQNIEIEEGQTEIRGNAKSKIYHCPGQAAYDEMKDSINLVIFHSEQEAAVAGYR